MSPTRIKQAPVATVLDRLAAERPDPRPELDFTTNFQLLVAVILSAQCTDKRVNEVTAQVFPRFGTPEAFAAIEAEELEPLVRPCGLGPSKARNIVATARILVEQYGGEVPASHEALIKLPGVGRKTANVVVSTAFDIPAIAVDTHVFRLSHRLGWSSGKTPDLVEADLQKLIPMEKWSKAHHWLILHGRYTCVARKPKCESCQLQDICPRLGV